MTLNNHAGVIRVGIAGLGTVGRDVATALNGRVPGVALSAVSARNVEAARDWLREAGLDVPVVGIDQLEPHCDVVIECAPSALMRRLAEPVLRAGKKLVVLSSGAMLDNMDLIELADRHGARIIVPTGALLGLDAVKAAAEGRIESVKMVSRKPVEGFRGAPFLVANGIDIEGIDVPKRLFSGKAREAATGFPANLNVAISLSLAGIGVDQTQLEIWADPTIQRNTHTITVVSDSALFSMTIENIPTSNPKTGRITAQSVLAVLRQMTAPMRVGT
ncbi:aspartate dehydrogenase [Alloalcanivorax sp. C16-2]|uniref:aspartate dehydrogenase n=1 Tax=Alloalcanivorax TaxID=3020832 RepID=UPI00193224C6|nr:aspartate dehydrogenase [Alloalcanivorax marinus]MBL7250112.1 aspartate dehydrogenase [Alloalcanivorax marinus]